MISLRTRNAVISRRRLAECLENGEDYERFVVNCGLCKVTRLLVCIILKKRRPKELNS